MKATAEFICAAGGVRLAGEGEPPGCSMRWTRCPGIRRRSRTRQPTAATGGSPPAPSSCCRRRKTCRSRSQPGAPARSHVTDLHGNPVSAVAALGVARASARSAPQTWPGTCVSNGRLSHFTGSATPSTRKTNRRSEPGPAREVMAALRNLAICALRPSGRADVTEATRWASRSMDRPFASLGLNIMIFETAVQANRRQAITADAGFGTTGAPRRAPTHTQLLREPTPVGTLANGNRLSCP